MKYWLRRIWWGAWPPRYSKEERNSLYKMMYDELIKLYIGNSKGAKIGYCFAFREALENRLFRAITGNIANVSYDLKNMPELIQHKPILRKHRWGTNGLYWFDATDRWKRLEILNAAILKTTRK